MEVLWGISKKYTKKKANPIIKKPNLFIKQSLSNKDIGFRKRENVILLFKMQFSFKKWFLMLLLPLLIIPFSLFYSPHLVYGVCEVPNSSDINVLQLAKEECQKEIDSRMGAHEKNKEALDELEINLDKTKKLIQKIGLEISNLNKEISTQEENLAYQEELLAARIRSYYKKSRLYSPFLIFLVSSTANDLFRELSYRKTAADNDKEIISEMSKALKDLANNKEELEKNKEWLSSAEAKLNKNTLALKGEVEDVESYFTQVSGKIAELSAKQRAILVARSGSFITSVGSVPIGSDYDASIAGFESGAPNGYFAVFSFGAYTHRKGMSQYGTKARAESGENYRDILRAYYGKEPVSKDTGGSISVSGYGDLSFEDYYLMGIAEMPSDWHVDALKAQAVAARTYAYRYKIEGKSICATESCQVFNKSKADNPPENWRNAVQQTRGEILEDVVTFYSSTSGGYLTTMGWDTTDGSGNSDWTSRAWESKAGSPWFYKAWYREKYRNNSNNCGRKPWMSEEEMADILNAWLVLNKGEGNDVDTSRILPVTINQCPIGGQSGNPYNIVELRNKLNNPVVNISGEPSVSHDGNGNTTMVTFQTNRGSLSVPGYEFKERFNGRAPGYLSIPQSGFAFFNIERK